MPVGFLEQLQKRKVLRVAAAYGVVAWIVLQVADILLPALRLSEDLMTWVVVALAACFPVAIVMAWFFEITPQGLRRDSREAVATRKVTSLGRGIDFAVIGVLAGLVVWLGWERYVLEDKRAALAEGDHSIAVLPFENVGGNPENAYFSDGLSEELMNTLSQIPGLRVAGRTSSFHFRNANADPTSMGEKLGVQTVLEGSVRRAGNNVRINAQLVEASSGFQIWSDRYDYELDNVFSVQTEIAEAVAQNLQVELLGDELGRRSAGTTNVDALREYRLGREAIHERLRETVLAATDHFAEAVRLDPNYAAAWAGLAESYILQASNFKILEQDDAVRRADDALGRAMTIDDSSAEVWAAVGLTRYQEQEYEAAEAALERAIELNPSYAEAWHWYGLAELEVGRVEQAYVKLEEALKLDVAHPVISSNYGRALAILGRFEDARQHFEHAIQLDPEFPNYYMWMSNLSVGQPMSRPDDAMYWAQQAYERAPDQPWLKAREVLLLLELDQPEAARAMLESMPRELRQDPQMVIANLTVLVYSDDEASVVEALDQRLAAIDPIPEEMRAILIAVRHQFAGNFDLAQEAWLVFSPQLGEEEVAISDRNDDIVTLVAWNYAMLGDQASAVRLLDAYEEWIGKRSRLGPEGYGLSDVEVAIMRGDVEGAMARLNDAWAAGYRSRIVKVGWTLDTYPLFEPLWDRADFQAIAQQLDEYVENLEPLPERMPAQMVRATASSTP